MCRHAGCEFFSQEVRDSERLSDDAIAVAMHDAMCNPELIKVVPSCLSWQYFQRSSNEAAQEFEVMCPNSFLILSEFCVGSWYVPSLLSACHLYCTVCSVESDTNTDRIVTL